MVSYLLQRISAAYVGRARLPVWMAIVDDTLRLPPVSQAKVAISLRSRCNYKAALKKLAAEVAGGAHAA